MGLTTFTSAGSPDLEPTGAGRPPEEARDYPRSVSEKTSDYWLSLAGSLLGSGGLTWLLYTQVLPFTGPIGYLACWFVCYLAMFATVTALAHGRLIVLDRLWTAVITGAAALVGLALVSAVGYVVVRGWTAMHHVNFFTKPESASSPTAAFTKGGILNAMIGSLFELSVATLISLPLGIGTAIYMVEVGGWFARVVRTVVEAMTALPDILAGLFIYTFLIIELGVQRSGFAAGVALSVMMLPIIARSADVALRVVPGGLREASYALGSTQWRTVWSVVLPTQRTGLATAVILGMARAVGETAPVLITSGASTFTNPTWSQLGSCVTLRFSNCGPLNEPMNSLPLYIFTAVRSGLTKSIDRGFGAGIVLLAMVLILFGTARFLSRSKVARR
jgi:phosphate transport system permease protein